ncbi:hypothetical protein [Oceanithermus sp.]
MPKIPAIPQIPHSFPPRPEPAPEPKAPGPEKAPEEATETATTPVPDGALDPLLASAVASQPVLPPEPEGNLQEPVEVEQEAASEPVNETNETPAPAPPSRRGLLPVIGAVAVTGVALALALGTKGAISGRPGNQGAGTPGGAAAGPAGAGTAAPAGPGLTAVGWIE